MSYKNNEMSSMEKYLKMLEEKQRLDSDLEKSKRSKAQKESQVRDRLRRDNRGNNGSRSNYSGGAEPTTRLEQFFKDYNIPSVTIPHYKYEVLEQAVSASNASVLAPYHVEIPVSEPDRRSKQQTTMASDDEWNAPMNSPKWR